MFMCVLVQFSIHIDIKWIRFRWQQETVLESRFWGLIWKQLEMSLNLKGLKSQNLFGIKGKKLKTDDEAVVNAQGKLSKVKWWSKY